MNSEEIRGFLFLEDAASLSVVRKRTIRGFDAEYQDIRGVCRKRAGALVLVLDTSISLVLANTLLGEERQHVFHVPILGMPIEKWVNDGLLVIFFLMIGLELEGEIYRGEFSS